MVSVFNDYYNTVLNKGTKEKGTTPDPRFRLNRLNYWKNDDRNSRCCLAGTDSTSSVNAIEINNDSNNTICRLIYNSENDSIKRAESMHFGTNNSINSLTYEI
jgi:hypothetical protein